MKIGSVMHYAGPYRWRLAGAGLLSILEAGTMLAFPWFAGQAAHATLSTQGATSGSLVLPLVGLLAAQAILRFASRFIASAVAADILADLRNRVFDHLQALPLAFHHRHRQGETLALLTHDVGILSGFISGTLVQLVPLCITAAGAVVLMLHLDAILALVVAALVPLYYLILKLIGRRLRDLAQKARGAEASLLATTEESLRMLDVIKAFTREEETASRYRRQTEAIAHLSTTQGRINAAVSPLMEFVTSTSAVLLIALASTRLSSGGMSAAETISFLLYAVVVARPLSRMAGVYGQVQAVGGALARLEDVLCEAPEPRSGQRMAYTPGSGAISFQDVTFAYPGRSSAISNFSVDIAPGEVVALTGFNGAGKSTLAHLLLRFYEPESGRILIDGMDIADLDLRSLRQHIGLVPQHVSLLNASVRENIAFAVPGATYENICRAARLAQAHEFISGLPNGYDTIIGDNGIRLSGGQRQRIALARALLKDPPILILDEATAMFDPEGERAFIKDAREALSNRTVILITHRPASLSLANRVISIGGGAVVVQHAAA